MFYICYFDPSKDQEDTTDSNKKRLAKMSTDDFLDLLSGEMIAMHVGRGVHAKYFSVHKKVLCAKNETFRHMIETAGPNGGDFYFEDEDSKAFGVIVQCLFNCPLPEMTDGLDALTTHVGKNGDHSEGEEQNQSKTLGDVSAHSEDIIRHLEDAARSEDGQEFRLPVRRLWQYLAKRYLDTIQDPIDLDTMKEKLLRREYTTFEAIEADLDLMVYNSAIFNGLENRYAKAA